MWTQNKESVDDDAADGADAHDGKSDQAVVHSDQASNDAESSGDEASPSSLPSDCTEV